MTRIVGRCETGSAEVADPSGLVPQASIAPGGAAAPAFPDFALVMPSRGDDYFERLMQAASIVGVGLRAVAGSRSAGRPAILTYHRVTPAVPGVPFPLHNVTPRRFAAQLEGLLRRGFQFWPLRRLLEHAASSEPIPANVVVVTFDDGFANVRTNALPIMQRLGVPATVFVNTAYLGSSKPFPFDAWGVGFEQTVAPEHWRPLTIAECHELQRSGLVDIGCHTHTHADFRGKPEVFRDDLTRSVTLIREWFDVDAVPFAFPFGSVRLGFGSPDLCAVTQQVGVTCALTTESVLVDRRSSPHGWGRFNAFSWDTAATLAAKLDGWYGWARDLKRRMAGLLWRTD